MNNDGWVDEQTLNNDGWVDETVIEDNKGLLAEPSFVQGEEPSFTDKTFDRLFTYFKDPEKEKAKAVQALVDSEALGISPSSAYRYRDQIDDGVKLNPMAVNASKRTTLTERVNQSWETGKAQVQQGLLASKFMINGDMAAYDEALKIKYPEYDFISEGRIESAVRAAAKMLPMTVDVGKEFFSKGLPVGMGAGATVAILGQLGPQAALPEEVITVPAATALGFKAGGTAAAYKRVMELEGGLAVMELMNIEDAEGNKLDPNTVRAASLGIGAVNGLIELAQIKLLLKTVPGLERVLGKAIIDTISSKTLKERLAKTAVKYGGVVLAETGQELGQESTNIIAEALAIELNNAAKGTDIPQATLEEILDRYYEIGTESAQAFMVMALPGSMATAAYKGGNKPKKVNPSKPPVQDSPVVKQAQETVQSYNGKKPIILGVDETEVEGENVITSFTMADPVTGDVFTVPASQKIQDDTVSYLPDQNAINDRLEKTTSDDLDAQIDRMIEGDDTAIEQVFGKEADVPNFEAMEDITPKEIVEPTANVEGKKPWEMRKPELDKIVAPLKDGYVRFYHGGTSLGNAADVTPDIRYAAGYAKNKNSGIEYIDVPENSPFLKKSFDDTGADIKSGFVSFRAPSEMMKEAIPVSEKVLENYSYLIKAQEGNILDTVKSINDTLGEKGSIDLEPIVNLGRSIINEGHKTYEAFTARAKEVLGETWEKVKDLVEQAWNTLKNERGSVSIKPMTPKKGTASDIPAKTTPQAEAGIKKIYHGTDKSFTDFDITKTADGSIWFTDDINKINSGDVVASGRGKIVKRYVDENKLKLGGWEESDKYSTDQLISMGYDGLKLVDDGETTYQIFNPEKLLKKLPNPSRPPEVGGQSTLYSGVDITQTLDVLRGLKGNIKEAMPHLEALGSQVYQSGKVKFNEWSASMKETLGDLWESFKEAVKNLWANREKWVGNEIGAIGDIDSPIHDAIAYIKENGGLNIDKLSKQYPKETIDVLKKKGLATKGGFLQLDVVANEFQFEDDELLNKIIDVKSKNKIKAETSNKAEAEYLKALYNNEKVSREEFNKAVNDARKAFKEGNAEELARLKKSIKWMAQRKETLKNVRDYFNLTDTDMSKISKKNPLLMDEQEFAQYLKDVNLKAIDLKDNKWAKIELMSLIEDKRLQKVDNYRRALELPSINEMTTEQLRQFARLLEPFQYDDVFLTQRELETVDKTDLKGIKTWREAKERLAKEAGVPIEKLANIKVPWNANFRWDSSLREQDPFFDLLVSKMTESMMGAEMKVHNVETMIYDLAKKAEKSRNRGLIDRMIPQDELIFAYLESPSEEKNAVAQQMTPEQIRLAHYMNQYFSNALNYLIAIQSVEHGRENYITHIRKSFMENMRDKGIKEAIGGLFTAYQEDQMAFNILDNDTGNILPLEKFFQYSLHRTGELDPTKNVVRAFMTYAAMFEKKKAFDAIIPKLDIYTQSLTPVKYTPRGLEFDRSLKQFVNKWINNKKGRKISYDSAIRQGGPLDLGIRALRTLTTMIDLGFYVPAQAINFMGEQITTMVPLGYKDYAKSIALIRTEKGKRILKKYEFFTERSLWEEFTAPGKEIQQRLMDGMFGFFHISSVAANKQFLLASMTEQEWANEELSPERLAQIKLDMGRFRAIPGTNSLVGSTSLGKSGMQYKAWAVSPTRTLIKDISTMAEKIKKKQYGDAFTADEAKEIYRIAGFTIAITTLAALAGDDDDDGTFIGKMKARAIREIYTLTQGMDPTFWLSWRSASYLKQLGTALKNLLFLEEYKTKEGLKGVDQLKKAVTPGLVRAFPKSKEE